VPCRPVVQVVFATCLPNAPTRFHAYFTGAMKEVGFVELAIR